MTPHAVVMGSIILANNKEIRNKNHAIHVAQECETIPKVYIKAQDLFDMLTSKPITKGSDTHVP